MTTAEQNAEAFRIAKRILDSTTACFLSGDAEQFADHFALPQLLGTVEGSRLVRTRDDLIETFGKAREYFANHSIVRIEREVETALFDGPDLIRQSYLSRYLSGSDSVEQRFSSYSVLQRLGGQWKVVSNLLAMQDRPAHQQVILGAKKPDAVTFDNTTKPPSHVAEIFQNLLDGLTEAYMEGDFDKLCARVQFPLFMQMPEYSMVMPDRRAMREDFERYRSEIAMLGVTDIIRTVKSADMLGDGCIHGVFRSYVLSDTVLARPSYVSAMTLHQGDDKRWRAATILHPMGHFLRDHAGPTGRPRAGRTDKHDV
ncbi:hypothetical protein [Cognatishimia sp. F0-27]|uniref:hypothetical protein n=1 Tax=Cognatishimia sp. F0-27 TaxID=2816855 RepID=UPI001D0CCDD8|nr:hypothetical protein [Cognatishimia sp. F0-27]MCC1493251.1 hypothetical protein [Cognatishimia sp. F0-27]